MTNHQIHRYGHQYVHQDKHLAFHRTVLNVINNNLRHGMFLILCHRKQQLYHRQPLIKTKKLIQLKTQHEKHNLPFVVGPGHLIFQKPYIDPHVSVQIIQFVHFHLVIPISLVIYHRAIHDNLHFGAVVLLLS